MIFVCFAIIYRYDINMYYISIDIAIYGYMVLRGTYCRRVYLYFNNYTYCRCFFIQTENVLKPFSVSANVHHKLKKSAHRS